MNTLTFAGLTVTGWQLAVVFASMIALIAAPIPALLIAHRRHRPKRPIMALAITLVALFPIWVVTAWVASTANWLVGLAYGATLLAMTPLPGLLFAVFGRSASDQEGQA